jgi:hypothetical protein
MLRMAAIFEIAVIFPDTREFAFRRFFARAPQDIGAEWSPSA